MGDGQWWDDRHDDYLADQAQSEWFDEQIAEQIEEIFDSNQRAVFRAKVAAWSAAYWAPAEAKIDRIGGEAREHEQGLRPGPAVVWAATCAELTMRDLTIKPIFVGLFLGETWVDAAVNTMLNNRWGREETRTIVTAALRTVVGFEVGRFVAWSQIAPLIKLRNRVVHEGDEATPEQARQAIVVVDGLFGTLLPVMRAVCGIT